MSKQGFSNYLKGRVASSTRSNYLRYIQVDKYITRLKGLTNFDIFSIVSVTELDDIIELLKSDPAYCEEDKKTRYHSSCGLKKYREYLCTLPQNAGTVNSPILPIQVIYFGAPGSGKSRTVKEKTKNMTVYRTTFHPDSDYASFIGCYKPEMAEGKITYTFTPQVFTKAYVHAWEHPEEQVYLVIEEINRGNCAQIFGDLFQLLDRKDDGTSEYPIHADNDLAIYLQDTLSDDAKQGIAEGKLCLPANLHIIATMNTSDQSLFPMDSAFKRRWDWEYIPINYSDEVKSGQFEIAIGKKENQKRYRWIDFLKVINERILGVTQSEDKQMGNFFIKTSIEEQTFKSKVMAYLWHEICKDEYGTPRNFFRFSTNSEETKEKEFTFNNLYEEESHLLLQGFMTYLGVPAIS